MAGVTDPKMKALHEYLWSQRPTPPNQKEKDRMARAIAFDLEMCGLKGWCPLTRMETFKNLGYLYG